MSPNVPPSRDGGWYTPGLECLVCKGKGTELIWDAALKAYVCKDTFLCSDTVVFETDFE